MFETSKALRAAIDILQAPAVAAAVPALSRARAWMLLAQYTAVLTPGVWTIINGTHCDVSPADPAVLAPYFLEGAGRAWIAEAGCADSGNWTDNPLQGYWYNHASYTDIVLSAVAGIVPAAWSAAGGAPSLAVAPLVPADDALAYFCADAVRVGGRDVTVLWDADGSRYGRGTGLMVLLDGVVAAQAATLQGPALVVTL